jgi:hypothetical protein
MPPREAVAPGLGRRGDAALSRVAFLNSLA